MRLAFIVPYRDRRRHLSEFIPHYTRRFRDLQIYIIQQGDNKPFNRGALINAGFKEFHLAFDYFAAHDVDMLCTKGDYSYPSCPTQLATHVEQFKYRMPFPEYFGGVTLYRNEDFFHCDGFSNEFWGYGAEDEEMYKNVLKSGLKIAHRDCYYESLHHLRKIDPVLHQRNVQLRDQGRSENDGLKKCVYEVTGMHELDGYTMLTVCL